MQMMACGGECRAALEWKGSRSSDRFPNAAAGGEMELIMRPFIQPFFDPDTETFSYVVYDEPGGRAAVIDSVLDFDYKAGRISTGGAERIVAFVRERGLTVDWILETHAHADHLSAAQFIRERLGGKVAIGEHIREVQKLFRDIYNLGPSFPTDGNQFDRLFADGESFQVGELEMRVMHTPGHTLADMAWMVEDAVFIGDTLFMPDVGTARCDFPGGDARKLYHSIRKLLALPEQTRLFLCHDYPPPGSGRSHAWFTTVGEQRRHNIHVHDGVSEDEFVEMRERRDASLDMPRLILPAIQVNIRAGRLPEPEGDGESYLKIPLNRL
jgi:glyoxylase-like metal-dependent hydrolase (beta-lactamase superfamily II)